MTSRPQLDLFPSPSPSLIRFGLPAPDAESTKTLRDILRDNHAKHHGYFNRDLKFQNHITHHVLAIWSFGSHSEVLDAAYKHEAALQYPAFKAPDVITPANYGDHLGDDEYYSAYVDFFRETLEANGASAVLNEFVFSPAANTGKGEPSKAIGRFMDNLVHPMIHIGYGLEFGMPCLIVEGLALAATLSGKRVDALFPSALFEGLPGARDTRIPHLENFALDQTAPTVPLKQNIHTFDILERVTQDEAFDGVLDPQTFFDDTVKYHSKSLAVYADEWSRDITDIESAKRKVEELQWTVSLLYAITGYAKRQDGEFHADFMLMHLVTSSLFLSSYEQYNSLPSQKVLLQSYMTAVLAWWVSRGRVRLDIASFYESTTHTPTFPFHTVEPPKWSLTSSPENPWFAVMQHAIMHPDDHLCKIQRAFAHYATVYGAAPAGHFGGTSLRGAELIDGTLFIRAAGLTAERTSRASDEGKSFVWDVNWVGANDLSARL